MSLSRRYLLATLFVASLIIVYYLHYTASLPGPPSGRTRQGLVLGILGFAAMVGALLYSVRRRFIGRAMRQIRVSTDGRKDIQARERRAVAQLQTLQRQALRNPQLKPAALRRQAREILREHEVTRTIRVRFSRGTGKGVKLDIERKEWAGRLEVWYHWHLMLGCLAVLLILTHAGFRFGNVVATLAFLCLVGVVASGILGYVLYRVIPPALTRIEERADKTPEELSEELQEVKRELQTVIAGKSQSFRDIYEQESTIPGIDLVPSFHWLFRAAEVKRDTARPDRLRLVVKEIPQTEQEDFRKMIRLLFQKEKLEVLLYPQLRYDYLLKIWLSLHIPLTGALMAFSLIHIVSVLYY
jgi:hypothetical protein